jgi:hypothetical protein
MTESITILGTPPRRHDERERRTSEHARSLHGKGPRVCPRVVLNRGRLNDVHQAINEGGVHATAPVIEPLAFQVAHRWAGVCRAAGERRYR